jgi:uncharacterized protein (DUF1778 family)
MTLQIALTPETEALLRQQAEAAGTDIASFALQALEEKLAIEREERTKLSPAQRAKEFLTWVDSHRPVGHFVDDSRDSIYEGRGE